MMLRGEKVLHTYGNVEKVKKDDISFLCDRPFVFRSAIRMFSDTTYLSKGIPGGTAKK